jgi:hypothetical protein
VFLLESGTRRSRLYLPFAYFYSSFLSFQSDNDAFKKQLVNLAAKRGLGDVERFELKISHTGSVCPKPEECIPTQRRIESSGSGGTAMSTRSNDSKNKSLLQQRKKDCKLCLHSEGERVKKHNIIVHSSGVDFKSPNVRFILPYPNLCTCES